MLHCVKVNIKQFGYIPLGEPPTEKQDALLLSQISSLMYVFAERILKSVTHRAVQHGVVYLIQECLGYDSSQHR